MSPLEESIMLKFRRQLPDESADCYFAHISKALQAGGKDILRICQDAVRVCTQRHCPGCD